MFLFHRIKTKSNPALETRSYYRSDIDGLRGMAVGLVRDVDIVFVGPTPQYDIYVTQCIPEWFRINKTDCIASYEDTFYEKNIYFSTLSDISEKSNNIYLWDPLDVLCENKICTPFINDKLIYRDKHHLSSYGLKSLAPSFIEFIQRLHY